MKMLCINTRGAVGLVAGQVYDVEKYACRNCGQTRSSIVYDFPLKRRRYAGCRDCHHRQWMPPYRTYASFRFIPWRPDELGVTEQEVTSLYHAPPKKLALEFNRIRSRRVPSR